MSADLETSKETPHDQNELYRVNIHKKAFGYCVRTVRLRFWRKDDPAVRAHLDAWIKMLPAPWTVAMEAVMSTGWIYDHLLPHAAAVKVAHPPMLQVIAGDRSRQRKNNCIDASKLAHCLRFNFLSDYYMASTEILEPRRTLRYRKLLVWENVELRNKSRRC